MNTDPRHSAPPTINGRYLGSLGLFAGLDMGTLDRLAAALPVELVQVGKTIVEEGELAQELFVVLSGELEVVKDADGRPVRIAMLGPGDWFGEMTLIDVQPRSATVRAVASTHVMRMHARHVDELLYRVAPKAYALFVMNIARELSRRLRVVDGALAQFRASVRE
ncbi:MAG: cyclic nucleotide-binding domain-containing protein [Myxococcales bacterium]|nr:cyclic nucleotide-binding domain-containing protein [Myxococcales bacterium]